ncbi:MAG: hypothetical protein HY928_06075 [Elusimicrobia bacterium]|nr:hypothetical protein [Elusimicrobiota bacterium]
MSGPRRRSLRVAGLLAAALLSGWLTLRDAARFHPPDSRALEAALGDVDDDPARSLLRAAADAAPLGPPARGDWLAEHSEPGQPFDAYASRQPRQRRPGLRPIAYGWVGDAPPEWAQEAVAANRFLALLFQTTVRAVPLPDAAGVKERVNSGRRQLLASEVLERLRPALPAGTACLLGFTAHDLYPLESWNFVFGLASVDGRVGVHSVARLGSADGKVRRRRLLGVAGHEAGHSFGLLHCVHRRCLMNGFNSLAELDRGTLALCPICLRKVAWGAGVDVISLHEDIAAFLDRIGLTEDAAVFSSRLAAARAPAEPRPRR